MSVGAKVVVRLIIHGWYSSDRGFDTWGIEAAKNTGQACSVRLAGACTYALQVVRDLGEFALTLVVHGGIPLR